MPYFVLTLPWIMRARSHHGISKMERWNEPEYFTALRSLLICLGKASAILFSSLLSYLDTHSWDLHSCRPFGGAWGGFGGIPACSSAPAG